MSSDRWIVGSATAVFVVLCAVSGRAEAATTRLDHYFQALAERREFSGSVLVTQQAEQLFAAAYGLA
ncbi:hypothetical protein E4M02_01465 [Brevundimonas sp. S30B]|uniref:hypothetical protein n=1 Tax=unclassified Brevundimonas TaxID=2622653 RepID=UPI001072ADCC|nr:MULTISPECIES: hypothetical protein [unclassified Brevundimonas]QBX37425.1 hypothetical protein E4M01_06355 [Brevundimonas sp. MF30-B]TFW03782.1 hypothetical protein E4M02_01465 [Brevundimonas sp. S30B]